MASILFFYQQEIQIGPEHQAEVPDTTGPNYEEGTVQLAVHLQFELKGRVQERPDVTFEVNFCFWHFLSRNLKIPVHVLYSLFFYYSTFRTPQIPC